MLLHFQTLQVDHSDLRALALTYWTRLRSFRWSWKIELVNPYKWGKIIPCSEDKLDVFWTSHISSMFVLCPGGIKKEAYFAMKPKHGSSIKQEFLTIISISNCSHCENRFHPSPTKAWKASCQYSWKSAKWYNCRWRISERRCSISRNFKSLLSLLEAASLKKMQIWTF